MFCSKCGSEFDEDAKFCSKCGFKKEKLEEMDNKPINTKVETGPKYSTTSDSDDDFSVKLIIGVGAVIAIFVLFAWLFSCSARAFTCDYCGKTAYTAYQTLSGDSRICKECAVEYWAPFDVENFKVK